MAGPIGGRFASRTFRQFATGGALAGLGALVLGNTGGIDQEVYDTRAGDQFRTSSRYASPKGFVPFALKYDYPKPSSVNQIGSQSISGSIPPITRPGLISDPNEDFPWLKIDFTEPEKYCQVVKEYCWEGFDWKAVTADKKFDIWQNKFREWYHAPWMHWSLTGREPINGLTFERVIPAGEFSKTQKRRIQNYAVGMYNRAGATVFGKIWADPSKPNFDENAKFPVGTCVFKILATEATDEEFPNMKGAPKLSAVMGPVDDSKGYYYPKADPTDATKRIMFPYASEVRLVQVDFAVVDPRAPIGWVFGTFMYDGSKTDANPWDRIIPVGMQWGNDPQAVHAGDPIKESWLNPVADKLRESLGGSRPSWGWHGRMNGPADNFISACASCHSTAEKTYVPGSGMTPPQKINGRDTTDEEKMRWFQNLPSGTPFDKGNISADYSLQLASGIQAYTSWSSQNLPKSNLIAMKRLVVPVQHPQPMDINQPRHP